MGEKKLCAFQKAICFCTVSTWFDMINGWFRLKRQILKLVCNIAPTQITQSELIDIEITIATRWWCLQVREIDVVVVVVLQFTSRHSN